MSRLALVTFGAEQYRVGAWRGHATVGYVAPLTAPDQLTRPGLEQALRRLRRQGFVEVLTAALTDSEQQFFQSAGFAVHERLHLLSHDLTNIGSPPATSTESSVQLRTVHRWHHRALLGVDARAFDPFWKLDRSNLHEAIHATPRTRVMGAFDDRLIGYAICGLAANHGYLQRLAVDPKRQGRGAATTLIWDALAWLVDQGATAASVNTQEANERAFALYLHLGFKPVTPGLAVLRQTLVRR